MAAAVHETEVSLDGLVIVVAPLPLLHFSTCASIQSRTTPATSSLFFSRNMKCPFPKMPMSWSFCQVCPTPACVRYNDVQWSHNVLYPDGEDSSRIGTFAILGSCRAGSLCRRHVDT